MRVLLTGATGFLGSHAAEAALAAGHAVRALVRPGRDVAVLAARGVEIARGDVTDPAAIEGAMAGIEGVLHVAGLIRARNEAAFARVNVFGARNVAEAAARAGAGRLVLVSSLAARGPLGASGPVTAYGRSKLAGERAVLDGCGKTTVVILRPTAIYGPRDRAILPFFRLAARGVRPVLAGAGEVSVVFGPDVARAAVGLLSAPVEHGTVWECSDGRVYRWGEIVATIAAAVGRPGGTFAVPRPVVTAAASLLDLVSALTGVSPILTRDKLAEIFGAWPADPGDLWRRSGAGVPTPLVDGMRRTAEAYRSAGLL